MKCAFLMAFNGALIAVTISLFFSNEEKKIDLSGKYML